MSELRYMLREASQGIRRNIGAALATVLIVFVTLSIAGTALLVKAGVDDVVGYLRSQVKIKLFVDPSADVAALGRELQATGNFASVAVETGAEMLDQMKQYFAGREYLFEAFQQGEIPATVTLDVAPGVDMDAAAADLKSRTGVVDVIYPQEFAQSVLSWSRTADIYGAVTIAILLVASFLTVCVAINLALHQRQKDIRIKLLLGAKDSHVRAQFLLEGGLLGLLGGLLATVTLYLLNEFALRLLEQRFSLVFDFGTSQLYTAMGLVVAFGLTMGLAGSYVTTRRLIENG